MTWALVAANLAAFAWVELHGSSTDTMTLVRFGALERGRVWSGEPWRLVTAAFLHGGWLHLASNMAATAMTGRLVERALGSVGFLVIYVASVIGGSSASLLGHDVVSVGASGAVFGATGAILVTHRRALESWRAFLRSEGTWILFAALVGGSIVADLVLPLDQLAHAGGFAFGAAAAWLLSRPERRVLPWAAFGVALAALTVAACWPRTGVSRLEAEEAGRAADAALENGDLEGAHAIARRLLRSGDAPIRDRARRFAVDAARTLGYRYYTGDGAPRDPHRGLEYFNEACALGDAKSCETAARIRGR